LIEIRKLPADRWEDYRDLRLRALRSEPAAFGSSFEEESKLTAEEWKSRIRNTSFAVSDDELIGMLACVYNDRRKTRHIADIVGVYVSAEHRGKGVGTRLIEHELSLIRKNRKVIKVKLAVNPEQRAAIRLYKKAGFVVTGRTKKELKVGRRFFDMLFMEKFL
jgi:ribosomal protein S18 acetylase RimI-like enzyme